MNYVRNNIIDRTCFDAAGGCACVATQQELGVLPERRPWIACGHTAHHGSAWQNIGLNTTDAILYENQKGLLFSSRPGSFDDDIMRPAGPTANQPPATFSDTGARLQK